MASMFMFNARGEWEGTRAVLSELDITASRRGKERFVVFDRIINEEEFYVPNAASKSWKDWELVKRPRIKPTISKASFLADGQDETVIAGLPIPCPVVVDGDEENPIIVEDGSLEFSATVKGPYTLTIELWPYLDYMTVVRAT